MLNEHASKIERISGDIRRAALEGRRVSFYHGGTNSTRTLERNNTTIVDISDLNEIIEINEKEKYILVEPNISMDVLLKVTLKYGMLPFVIPEFPGITCGGAVSGASLESSSWRYGQFNDSCGEYEVVLGNGEIVQASMDKNPDLFNALSGAYGTLGLITLIKIRLKPASPFVHLRYIFVPAVRVMEELKSRLAAPDFDYVEAIIFNTDNSAIIMGRLVKDVGEGNIQTFTKATDLWFYAHAETVTSDGQIYEEFVPITDYIFRYNRGAFWMGKYFFSLLHLPNTSFVKKLLNPFMNTRKLYDALKAFNLGQYYFLQDFYCPISATQKLLDFTEQHLGIYPIWLCPILPTAAEQKLSPHYQEKPEMLIDVGIWGRTKKYNRPVELNRMFEEYLNEIGGRKMLYAHAYYPEDMFWKVYDDAWYISLREKYQAQSAFPDVWQKVHVAPKPYKITVGRGIVQMLRDWIQKKNLNN